MKKKKKKKKNILKSMLILLFLISIILVGILGIQIHRNGGGAKGFLLTLLGRNKKEVENLKPIYVLVMGVSTDIDKELTDTIILCGYDPKTNEAMMLSIPRDTFIGKDKSKAKATEKINSLYSRGVNKTIKAVEEITSLEIDYYIVVRPETLVQVVDLIGGVKFDVPIDMKYDDATQNLHIDLKKGIQIIDGEKAEMLLRFRHNNDGTTYPTEYGNNDYGRMKTQREFIKSTISEVKKAKNLFRIKFLVETIFNNLETNLKIEDVFTYIPYVVNLDFDNIVMEQLPGISEKNNNLWIYIYDKVKTLDFIKK